MARKRYLYLFVITVFSFSCLFEVSFCLYAQEEDFWGGPTTPFTKSGDAETVNRWGSLLLRKLSRVVTHAIYDSVWNTREWNAFGAKHDFRAFSKNNANDKLYPQSIQILEPDDPTTYPTQSADNFFISPTRPFKRFIDNLHAKNNLITAGVNCGLVDIRDSWWLRFFPDMFSAPGKLDLSNEGGRRYLIHYALAQIAAGCDMIWYYKQPSYIAKNSYLTVEDWVKLIKETKDLAYKAYGKEVLVGGSGVYNKGVDYHTDGLFNYFYAPNNTLYEGEPTFLKQNGTAYREFLNSREGSSEVYHLDCSKSKLPYLHKFTFSQKDSLGINDYAGLWREEDLKSLGAGYSGPSNNGTTYGVPILTFIDWPLPMSDFITNVPAQEQLNFFYGMVPEMMAVGWRFCFPLNIYIGEKTEESEEEQKGVTPASSETPKISVYDKLKKLVDFYNYYSDLYQQQIVQWNEDPQVHSADKVSTIDLVIMKAEDLSYVVNEYRNKPYFTSIHLINHLYEDYVIQEQTDFSIEMPIKFKPLSVTIISPDIEDYTKPIQMTFSYKEGSIVMRMPKIVYYSVILIQGRPFTPTEEKEAFSLTAPDTAADKKEE